MFIKYPGREASWTTFIDPFDISLWGSLLATLCLLYFLLSVSYYFGPEKKNNPQTFTLVNNGLIVFASQLCQGCSIDPKSASTKLVFLLCYIFGILLYTGYTAKLISFLTVIKLTLPFTTLEGILGTDYGIGAVVESAVLDKMLYAPEGTPHLKVADEIIRKDPAANVAPSVEEGIEMAKAGKYAFVWTAIGIYGLTEGTCEILDIPYNVNSGLLALAWSKQLPHRHYFDYFIKKIIESGKMDRILKKWIPAPRQDCGNTGEFVSMGLDNMISAFALVLTGILLSLLILFIEISYHKCFTQRKM